MTLRLDLPERPIQRAGRRISTNVASGLLEPRDLIPIISRLRRPLRRILFRLCHGGNLA